MAMWRVERMETDRGTGPLALVCVEGENPVKFTLFDSDARVYDTISICVDRELETPAILALLTAAGYDPSEWHA